MAVSKSGFSLKASTLKRESPIDCFCIDIAISRVRKKLKRMPIVTTPYVFWPPKCLYLESFRKASLKDHMVGREDTTHRIIMHNPEQYHGLANAPSAIRYTQAGVAPFRVQKIRPDLFIKFREFSLTRSPCSRTA